MTLKKQKGLVFNSLGGVIEVNGQIKEQLSLFCVIVAIMHIHIVTYACASIELSFFKIKQF